MPIPKPKKGEGEKDFISRCMSAIGDEYKDKDQAVAVCYQSWKDKSKPKANGAVVLAANIDPDLVREEVLEGTAYKVAPVVMAVEGVMNDIFYPAEELGKFVSSWDGRPVTLYHPKDEQGEFISANSPSVAERTKLGQLYHTRFEEETLKSEVWINIPKTSRVRPEVLEYLGGTKDRLEVSTGLWGEVEKNPGEFNGTKYSYVMRNIRPDHLALLPGGEGACSWKDGCGLRANECVVANITDIQLREALVKALTSLPSRSKLCYIVEIDLSKKQVIYEEYLSTDGSSKLYRRGYTMENGAATIYSDPEEVVRVVSYETVKVNSKGEQEMKKDEMVQAIIDDPRTKFEEGCRGFLNALEEDQLDRLIPPDNVIVKPAEEPKTNLQQTVDKATKDSFQPNQEPKKETTPPTTAEEWLSAQEQMPKEVRDSILEGIALNTLQRAEMVESISKDPRNTFTNEQLQAKPTSELKALAAFVKPLKEGGESTGFFGMRATPSADGNKDQGPEPLLVPDLAEIFQKNHNSK